LTHPELKIASYQNSGSTESYIQPVLQFLNYQLRPQSDLILQDEYPSFFRGLPGGESLFIERENKIASHVGIMRRRYQHPGFQMELGLIGSVATHKDHRGEGLASFLLQEAVKRLRRQGCTLALLWSDQPDFYLPLGFHRAGNELDFGISVEKARAAQTCCRILNKEKDVESVWKLYQKRNSKVQILYRRFCHVR
jgi:predicted acetyltransferase